ncbi:MAG TPA: hypothetical protein VE956_03165 [Nodularia sp. (in: cyanobacteria)]|nr:hypothetical protein [Nodularia sp. (in: cyanobacteria)]
MSFQIIKTDLFEELSAEQQELLAGGCASSEEKEPSVGEEEAPPFGEEEAPPFGGSDNGDSQSRVRRIPIRLTGVLEIRK